MADTGKRRKTLTVHQPPILADEYIRLVAATYRSDYIALFGSVARGEATAESDLDVAVTFAEPVIQSGFGYFSAVEDLRRLLTRITGAPSIDIVPEPLSKERFRRNVERDRAVAY